MNLLFTLLAGFKEEYIIPIGLFLATVYSAYRGYRSSKSNSTTQTPDGTIDNTGNVSFFKTGGGVFSIILLIATIVAIIVTANER